ncbi:hypothetical protein DH2020_015412 [Rehmannia glutinosa]|uniref:Uncharacterized protein n=1 Tax=Rehmannia glutinosa TaxID=99300 RepID=A0ABR0WWS2_REHGL
MEAKTQIAFSILMFLFIFVIGDSLASPQVCNQFIGCTVTINICKTKCYHHYRGRGLCVSRVPLAPPPTLLQPAKLSKPGNYKCCRCKCVYPKKRNQQCASAKPPTTF